jgi:hypothetical protein
VVQQKLHFIRMRSNFISFWFTSLVYSGCNMLFGLIFEICSGLQFQKCYLKIAIFKTCYSKKAIFKNIVKCSVKLQFGI